MPENIEAWWERRQWSKGAAVPYAVGTYRTEWAKYPMLVRQYHPDLNREITLTQIPPAADVYLTWQCDSGHLFVATPEEQRSRPGRVRRRSAWCPVCADLAAPRRIRPAALWPAEAGPTSAPDAAHTQHRRAAPAPVSDAAPTSHRRATPAPPPDATPTSHRRATPAPPPDATPTPHRRAAPAPPPRGEGGRRRPPSARALPTRPAGEAFRSAHAPPTASAAEALLQQKLAARLEFDPAPNAVAVARPFHGRLEVWPDIVIAELRVALEYDTVGRFGLEHVGPREDSDRSKDRLLRAAGWEVVRIRCAPLPLLGPHDVPAPAKVTDRLIARLLDTLRTLRGDLIVNAYLRP
ncbi:zinc-ribbon domain-containing protein [Herbiconiux ginsengi]|uniref:Probable Zinc-ribbon domain-containing protein n=1 Tax=Herbiconiux ginsengi TaxID=381665 RepID=A0A1H3MV93_9MICO|nr:zinc-ribbon domain-containing protein [Herbiconiux ginsengi]SDY80642.1 Probable Zinc-ribbon domain-containing protein [Herbiconiux ginsengi]